MGPRKGDHEVRDKIAWYMGQGPSQLSNASAGMLAQDQGVQDCLFFLAGKVPTKMKRVFLKGLEITKSTSESNRKEAAHKSSVRAKDDGRKDKKRTKYDADYAGVEPVYESGFTASDRTRTTDVSIDSGDEYQTNGAQANVAAEHHTSPVNSEIETTTSTELGPNHDEHAAVNPACKTNSIMSPNTSGATRLSAMTCPNPVEGTKVKLEADHEQNTMANVQPSGHAVSATLFSPRLELAQQELDPARLSMNTPVHPEEVTEMEVDPEHTTNEAAQVQDSAISSSEARSEKAVEIGLTSGDPDMQNYICTAFYEQYPGYSTIPRSDLTTIFRTCAMLDLLMVQVRLVEHLNGCLSVSTSGGRKLPMTTEADHPHKIFDGLLEIKEYGTGTKLHRVFQQLNFHVAVNRETQKQGQPSRHKMLDKLAFDKASTASKHLRKQLADKYKREYIMGRRWFDTIEWFGGVGIALIFVIAGIAGNAVVKEWGKMEREFLKFVAPFLPTIQRFVRALGEDSLQLYCQQGFLPADRIRALEDIETYAQGEDNDDDDDVDNVDDLDDVEGSDGPRNSESDSEDEWMFRAGKRYYV